MLLAVPEPEMIMDQVLGKTCSRPKRYANARQYINNREDTRTNGPIEADSRSRLFPRLPPLTL